MIQRTGMDLAWRQSSLIGAPHEYIIDWDDSLRAFGGRCAVVHELTQDGSGVPRVQWTPRRLSL